VGTERGTTFIGRSLLVDYDGKVLASASDTEEELLVGEIDVEAARATHVRRRPGEHEWDTIADRRPGLYERLLQPGVDRQTLS
jgi:predicted amidohydrolase